MVKSKPSMTYGLETTVRAHAVVNGGLNITSQQKEDLEAWIEDRNRDEYREMFGHDIGDVGLVRAVQNGKNIGEETAKYQVMGGNIENAILSNQSEYDILYRGIEMSESQVELYVPGYVHDQKGTSSWASNIGYAAAFSIRADIQGTAVMFVAVGGRKAMNAETLNGGEMEWLHSKTTSFEVVENGDYGIPEYYNVNGKKVKAIVVKEL